MKRLYDKPDLTMEKLRRELRKEARIEVTRLGKDLTWLRFAKRIRKTFSYRILRHKQKQWLVLNNIINNVARRYPEFTKGQIVDELGNLVNDF